jgi:hypothetical protein
VCSSFTRYVPFASLTLCALFQDQWCLEEYCSKFGIDHTLKKRSIRKDTVKVFEEAALEKCPRRDQIRQVSFHYYAAKGPMFARSLARKILGNEEFCLQIDAHTSFAKNWDEILKQEWKNTENEFGIITTVPPPKDEQDIYQPGGTKEKEVPRQCLITYNDNGVPVSDIEGVYWCFKSQELVVSLVCYGSCVSFFSS